MLLSLLRHLTYIPTYVWRFYKFGPVVFWLDFDQKIEAPPVHPLAWETDYAVRLQIDQSGQVRIYGFPEHGDDLPGTPIVRRISHRRTNPFLHLRADVPAYIDYIMGPGWQTQLETSYTLHNSWIWPSGDVVLRPAWRSVSSNVTSEALAAEERAHCMKMRRCRAVMTSSQEDIVHLETNPEWIGLPSLLGWSSDGGVWVLPPPPNIDPFTAKDEIKLLWARYEEADKKIVGQTSMEAICSILEEAGARFYENASVCDDFPAYGLMS